ncbi:MAG: cystathionine beta-lyase [Rhodospirillales bacterium]
MTEHDDSSNRKASRATRLVTTGRPRVEVSGPVNVPVTRTSTILHPDLGFYERSNAGYEAGTLNYGRIGTPTTWAFEEAMADLEGGDGAVNYPSGLAAIAGVLSSFTKAGDHILVGDNVYGPTRKFCDDVLARYGVGVEYFDPMIGSGIRDLFKAETVLVAIEAPGSHTFEVCDVPLIAACARERGALSVMDNTWAAGYYFRPLEHGVDVVLQAATKYIVAHADAMLGFAATRKELLDQLKTTAVRFGTCAGTEECYLGLRGLRTLDVRMPRHFETGVKLAEWLSGRPEVETVLHPALDRCPGHETWKRDFTGASGLFGVVLKDFDQDAVRRLIDGMELYGLGDSWGGYESLLTPSRAGGSRTATTLPYKTPALRIHAGLEAFEDLRDDLAAGLDRLHGD